MASIKDRLVAWHRRRGTKKVDDARDRNIKDVDGVESLEFPYGPGKGKYWRLDVHRPAERKDPLPAILVVHGGGFSYGTKETYRLYGRYLAKQGFGVVVFSYPLAPEARFPTQLLAVDKAMEWLKSNGERLGISLEKPLLFGDSAGGHLAFHYAEICGRADLRTLFHQHWGTNFKCPLAIGGLGLNCATFRNLSDPEDSLNHWLGTAGRLGKELDPLAFVGDYLPPMYLLTGDGDFLLGENQAMHRLLDEAGIPHGYKEYVGKNAPLSHVFHCNLALEEALEANQDEIAYLMKRR